MTQETPLPGRKYRTWKEVRNEAMTQTEIDGAYEAIIDELKAENERLREALVEIIELFNPLAPDISAEEKCSKIVSITDIALQKPAGTGE